MNKPEFQNNFNFLRFLFASLVIVSHVPELQDGNRSHEILTQIFGTISFGELAVDCFFILSGFLIVKSWLKRPAFLSFLSSRLLRIYPGFIASCLICALLIGPLFSTPDYFQQFNVQQFFSGMLKLSLGGHPEVFPNTQYPALNGSMWSIPYEFKCYLLVLFCGMLGLLNKRWSWLLLWTACTLAYVAIKLNGAPHKFEIYIRLVMAFSAGGCFCLYHDKLRWNSKLAWASLALCSGLFFSHTMAEPALSLFGSYAILYFALHAKAMHSFNTLPDVSYGIYLYAWPVNKIVLWYYPHINLALAILTVFILSVIAGSISWYAVERPFMRIKNRIT